MCRRNFHAMRELVSLVVLGLLIALSHRLTEAAPLEARATLALGFLLLAAHVGGSLAARARLPRLTGFLVTGLAVGPAWAGLVRPDEIEALGFIHNGAVALIAFAVGGELKIETLRAMRRPITRLTAGATAFPFALIAAVTLAVSPWFPLTAGQGLGSAVAIALVLGTVATASSPAMTMAMMDELDARGPFARTVLGVTVAKDLMAIMLVTLVLAAARPLVSEGALHFTVAWTALVQLVSSLAVGAGMGFLVARYLRAVQRDTPLFLVALAFFTAAIARRLGLEAMLIALAAGFYVENFSRVEGERLVAALKRGSLPVYVVFFALAGASLDLGAMTQLWPWVLLLVGLRAVGMRYGVRWAGKSPAVTPVLADQAWLGLMSQAGLTLGLATVARRAFPGWGVSLEGLIVGMVGVHELIGPILFRRALRLAGEVKEATHVMDAPGLERHPLPLLPGGGV
jgi:Kef-type K+ transport system membrane component KefB